MALWATFGTGCPNYYPGYMKNNVKKTKAEKNIHSILISSNILTWNPQGEIVYHGRDIPGTNIENLLQHALLP
jgi:hypothetical protein